ncbi:MAG: 3-oxoacyl-ACP synthase [Bacteroidota bacterium]
MDLKQTAYQYCQTAVGERLRHIKERMAQVSESLYAETKSTAGDKHETGRAMLQLEREKLGQQLQEVQKMQQTLQQVPVAAKSEVVAMGSLVRTSNGFFYLAVSAGQCDLKDHKIYCISLSTPIAKALLGRKKNEVVSFRTTPITILEIH